MDRFNSCWENLFFFFPSMAASLNEKKNLSCFILVFILTLNSFYSFMSSLCEFYNR